MSAPVINRDIRMTLAMAAADGVAGLQPLKVLSREDAACIVLEHIDASVLRRYLTIQFDAQSTLVIEAGQRKLLRLVSLEGGALRLDPGFLNQPLVPGESAQTAQAITQLDALCTSCQSVAVRPTLERVSDGGSDGGLSVSYLAQAMGVFFPDAAQSAAPTLACLTERAGPALLATCSVASGWELASDDIGLTEEGFALIERFLQDPQRLRDILNGAGFLVLELNACRAVCLALEANTPVALVIETDALMTLLGCVDT